VGWSALVLAGVGLLVYREHALACPPGGPLAFDCGPIQAVVLSVAPLAAVLYVALLSAVVAWSRRLARRPNPDPTGGRDWYILAAVIGVPMAALLAFNILAGLGWLD
jgi:hypothetical protein